MKNEKRMIKFQECMSLQFLKTEQSSDLSLIDCDESYVLQLIPLQGLTTNNQ